MKQITYEEAIQSINKLIAEGDRLRGFTYSTYPVAFDFIEQYKPPTFDEVVKAWEKVNKDLNVYIHNNEFCVTDIDEEETSVFWYDIKTDGYEFECVSMEMIYAINLTIRYLQAKDFKSIKP